MAVRSEPAIRAAQRLGNAILSKPVRTTVFVPEGSGRRLDENNPMANPYSMGEINLDVAPESTEKRARPEPEDPFRIAVFGDFSGRAAKGVHEPLGLLKPIFVDRDDLDAAMAKLGASLRLRMGAGGPAVDLVFRRLDDFEPDQLYTQHPLFAKLRETRERLEDPATYAETANAILGAGTVKQAAPKRKERVARAADAEVPGAFDLGNLLDQAVEATEAHEEGREAPKPKDQLSTFLEDVVAPHLEEKRDPQAEELSEKVGEAAHAQMRALLSQSAVRALEAAWRGLDFLVRRLETNPRLKIYIVDVTKEELAASVGQADDLQRTPLHALLREGPAGAEEEQPWALLVGNYEIEPTIEDTDLLARLGMLGALAQAPFVSAADPRWIGSPSLLTHPRPDDWGHELPADVGELWDGVRRLPESAYLGLALPRFILRLPYGENTEPSEELDGFEEMPDGLNDQQFLWGNPAIAVAVLIGQTFTQSGWQMRLGPLRQIGDLPLYSYEELGTWQSRPPTEALMSDTVAEQVAGEGFMPLLGARGRDAAMLFQFRSISAPLPSLAGRWQ